MQLKLIKTERVLSETQIQLGEYVINPYRGCEFGCVYCYAQENKNSRNNTFFDSLGVKINAPKILERELQYKNPKRVLIGSTTECFQYQELNYGITEQILNLLNRFDVPYTILTKSHLVGEYVNILAKNRKNKIYFTLNLSLDKAVSCLEDKSPTIGKRLKAISAIIAKGIDLRLHVGPFIPHISNLAEIMSLLPSGIAEIDVELYHKSMGNFNELLKKIEASFGKALMEEIKAVYATEENYFQFAATIKKEIKKIKNNTGLTFFYIVPEFNTFYSSGINYETPL